MFPQGFLPENMFDRILTGPIVPEEVSRRGRRPKNALARMTAAPGSHAHPSSGSNPLLSNGLLSGLDLTSLQTLQKLRLTAGLLGLQNDPTNMAAMLPMMLSGMAGLPNLLGMGTLLGNPDAPSGEDSGLKIGGGEAAPEINSDRTDSQTAASSGQTLALNPLLLSSMIYPGVLLNPGLNLPVTNQTQATDTQPDLPAPPPAPEVQVKPDPVQQEPREAGVPESSTKAESSSGESGSSSSSSSSEATDSTDED